MSEARHIINRQHFAKLQHDRRSCDRQSFFVPYRIGDVEGKNISKSIDTNLPESIILELYLSES